MSRGGTVVGSRHFVTVIALLALTSVAVIFQPSVLVSSNAGILPRLPDRVGEYTGLDLLFCQNEHCAESFAGIATVGAEACAVCGGRMDAMSIAERKVLPEDTVIVRKRYTHPIEPPITVSIVFSGTEQRSIHRPQQCLPAQGLTIEHAHTLSVPLPARKPLRVMLLDMRGGAAGGGRRPVLSCYAYWFVGVGRETPYHMQRLFWMATDRIFHNVSHRWAYVALSTAKVREGSREHIARIKEFVAALYPLIQADGESP